MLKLLARHWRKKDAEPTPSRPAAEVKTKELGAPAVEIEKGKIRVPCITHWRMLEKKGKGQKAKSGEGKVPSIADGESQAPAEEEKASKTYLGLTRTFEPVVEWEELRFQVWYGDARNFELDSEQGERMLCSGLIGDVPYGIDEDLDIDSEPWDGADVSST